MISGEINLALKVASKAHHDQAGKGAGKMIRSY